MNNKILSQAMRKNKDNKLGDYMQSKHLLILCKYYTKHINDITPLPRRRYNIQKPNNVLLYIRLFILYMR